MITARRVRLGLIVILLAALGIALASIATTHDATPSGSRTAPRTTLATPTPSPAEQVAAWWDAGPNDGITTLTADLSKVNFASGGSVVGVGALCADVQRDAFALAALPAAPDVAVNDHWQRAVSLFTGAATDCAAATSYADIALVPDAFQRAANELTLMSEAIGNVRTT